MAKGKKTGGRVKGTPNKLTREMRTILKNTIFYQLEEIESNLKNLEPKERIELLIKLLPYVLPKVGNTQYDINEPIDFSTEL